MREKRTYASFQTALEAMSFLQELQSSRTDEFRTRCDAKFELSTVFKTSEEIATLRKGAIASQPEPPAINGTDDIETSS